MEESYSSIDQIRDTPLRVFWPMAAGNISIQDSIYKTVEYIDKISRLAGVNIDHWNIKEIFDDPATGYLHSDKGQINKIFFDKLERAKSGQDLDAEFSALAPHAFALVHHGWERAKNYTGDELGQKVSKSQQDMAKTRSDYEKSVSTAIRYQAQIEANRSLDAGYFKENMLSILRDKFYELADFGRVWKFATKPITLKYVNEAQAANLSVEMGKFMVEFNPVEMDIRVKSFANNIFHENDEGYSYIHPHVARDGIVCYGNLLSRFNQARALFDIPEMMRCTQNAIMYYCHENPYIHLHSFQEIRTGRIQRADGNFYYDDENDTDDDDGDEALSQDILVQQQRDARMEQMESVSMRVSQEYFTDRRATQELTMPTIPAPRITPEMMAQWREIAMPQPSSSGSIYAAVNGTSSWQGAYIPVPLNTEPSTEPSPPPTRAGE